MKHYKRTKKEQIKRAIIIAVIKILYYLTLSIIGVCGILLLFGTIGAMVDLCEHNKIYCICFVVVCGSYIVKSIINELNNDQNTTNRTSRTEHDRPNRTNKKGVGTMNENENEQKTSFADLLQTIDNANRCNEFETLDNYFYSNCITEY